MVNAIVSFSSAVIVNAITVIATVVRTFLTQLIIGLVIGLLILTFNPAHAAYQDPMIAIYGVDYTSWDVWCFYAKDSWKFIAGVVTLLVVFPLVGYVIYKEELSRYKARKELGL